MNVSDSPSIVKIRVGSRRLPDLSVNEDPLLEVSVPETLKNSPGRGLAEIVSMAILAVERTVIVFRICTAECKSEDPLNNRVTFNNPRGCSCGISKPKATG